jgi:hypothetical protein
MDYGSPVTRTASGVTYVAAYDGSIADAGELNYAGSTLVNGAASVKLPTLAGTGTYRARARVTDLPGNEGTSGTDTFPRHQLQGHRPHRGAGARWRPVGTTSPSIPAPCAFT